MNQPANEMPELIADNLCGLAPLEVRPASEAAAVTSIVQAIEGRVRAAAATAPAQRDAHPKMHGCVQAEFRVLEDLPASMRVGLFEQPRSFQTWVRFSNGSGRQQPDAVGDGRGMAIKVMGVAASPSGTQDFVMINAPTFFVRNAADYVELNAVDSPLKFFFPGLNPFRFRLHEFAVALGITRRKVSNPLNVQYWSTTPYLFGDAAMKFSARPVGALSPFEESAAPDFLHDNLVSALGQAEAAFEFCVQLRTDRGPDDRMAGSRCTFRSGRADHDPQADLRYARPGCLRRKPVLHALAWPGRAPTAGRHQPGAPHGLRDDLAPPP
jgi:hypothetical protein